MIFTEISNEELEKFQQNNNERYFFPQSAEYSKMANSNGLKTTILAVKEDNKVSLGFFKVWLFLLRYILPIIIAIVCLAQFF